MKLTLWRNRFFETHTIGQLYVDGVYFCFVLEDKVREVDGEPVEKWKVKNVTAIPYGTYNVSLQNSPKFGPETLTLDNVPGFTYIHMHPGNTDKDTEGCLILGYGLDANNNIRWHTTRTAVADLKLLVKNALVSGDKVSIEITQKSAATSG